MAHRTGTPRRRAGTQLGAVAAASCLLALAGCAGPQPPTSPSATADTTSSADRSSSSPASDPPASDPPASDPPASDPPASDPPASDGAPVPESLDFTAEDVDGEPFAGADLAGSPAVLWFWAPWCTVCARSAGDVRDVAAANPTVRFVGVAGLASDRSAMQEFVQRNEVEDLTHLADVDGALYTRFGITQQHTFVLVDVDGGARTVAAYSGQVDLGELVEESFG